MNQQEEFLLYLDGLKTIDNHVLVESVKQGFTTLNEYLYVPNTQVAGRTTDIMEDDMGDNGDDDDDDEYLDSKFKKYHTYDDDDEQEEELTETKTIENKIVKKQLLDVAHKIMDIVELSSDVDELPKWMSDNLNELDQSIDEVRNWFDKDAVINNDENDDDEDDDDDEYNDEYDDEQEDEEDEDGENQPRSPIMERM